MIVVVLRRLGILGAVVILLLAASCVSLPLDSSWGAVSLIGEPSGILLAFADRIVQVDPNSGQLVNLRDSQGGVRLDNERNPLNWLVQDTSNNAPQHFYTSPVQIDDQTLVVVSYEGKLIQIDIASAQISYANSVQLPGHVVGNPLLTDNFLYVPLSDGGLVALSPTNFSTTWHFTGDEGKGVWSQPLLIDDTLYVSSMNHFLFALDAQTGTEKWNLDLEGAVASTPTYADGALYVGSFARKVFKITLDGSIVAQFPTNDWVWGAPAVVDDRVYVTDLGGSIYTLQDSGSSLDEVWSRKVAGGAIRMTPLVTEDMIVVGSRDHKVYWVDRETGEEIFHQETPGEVLSNILLIEANDTIREPMIVVSTLAQDKPLVAFTLDQSVNRWVYPPSS